MFEKSEPNFLPFAFVSISGLDQPHDALHQGLCSVKELTSAFSRINPEPYNLLFAVGRAPKRAGLLSSHCAQQRMAIHPEMCARYLSNLTKGPMTWLELMPDQLFSTLGRLVMALHGFSWLFLPPKTSTTTACSMQMFSK